MKQRRVYFNLATINSRVIFLASFKKVVMKHFEEIKVSISGKVAKHNFVKTKLRFTFQ